MNRYTDQSLIEAFDRMLGTISEAVVISHTNPDGDAVGSATAMQLFLNSRGVKSVVLLPDQYPDYLSFLDNGGNIVVFDKSKGEALELIDRAGLICCVDFNQLKRVNQIEEHILNSNAMKVLIDHHPVPQEEPFDIVFSCTEVSSTCELVYWMIMACKEEISEELARSLYVGMMTDTNNFANSVTSDTFLMASHLLRCGVDKEALQHEVFGGFSENRMRLMGYMLLNKMVILEKFRAGYITLSLEEQKRFGFSDGDSEGFVNLPLNIKGVNISALFTEKEDQIRVSLRSVNEFSVNQLSRLCFNGGGHERAAGGRLNIPLDQVGPYFERALERSFDECMLRDI